MSWFTKVLGIDAKRNARAQAQASQAAADRARAAADAQAAETARQTAEYQRTLMDIQNNAAALQSANEAAVPDASNVVTGGEKSLLGNVRRKKKATDVASTLGINI